MMCDITLKQCISFEINNNKQKTFNIRQFIKNNFQQSIAKYIKTPDAVNYYYKFSFLKVH